MVENIGQFTWNSKTIILLCEKNFLLVVSLFYSDKLIITRLVLFGN